MIVPLVSEIYTEFRVPESCNLQVCRLEQDGNGKPVVFVRF